MLGLVTILSGLGTGTDQPFVLVVRLFGFSRGAHQDLVLFRCPLTTTDSSVIISAAPVIILIVTAGSGSSWLLSTMILLNEHILNGRS